MLSLHSSMNQVKSQRLCHDDSTINITMMMTIVITTLLHCTDSIDAASSYRWSSVVCLCVLVTTATPATMAEAIQMLFGVCIRIRHILDEGPDPTTRRTL